MGKVATKVLMERYIVQNVAESYRVTDRKKVQGEFRGSIDCGGICKAFEGYGPFL